MKEHAIFYHFDQIVLTCYCPVSAQTRSQLKEVVKEGVKFSESKTGNRVNIILFGPSCKTLETLFLLVRNYPYDISKIEMAKDTVYDNLYSAERALNDIAITTYRNQNFKFNDYNPSNDKACIAPLTPQKKVRSDLIGTRTLYFGFSNFQFVAYCRKYNGHIVLREEIRISHHARIQRVTGINTLCDLFMHFNIKSFLDDWIDKNMRTGTVDYKRISSAVSKAPRQIRKDFPYLCESMAQYFFGDSPAQVRHNLNELKLAVGKKRGRKTTQEKRLLKMRISDVIR